MTEQRLEIADVFRAHQRRFLAVAGSSLSSQQRQVMRAITACRSAVLGGHVQRCDGCGHEQIAYNSCRNRHCPKCQAGARAAWMAARERELLPVPYFHVVFTIPHCLAPLALQNKKMVYGLLFQAAAETLLEVAANPRHLGAKIGVLAILHTWGQNLMHHPHLHCVVPGGGVAPDGQRWVHCRRGKAGKQPFFLPVRVLSRVFRGKFIQKLKRAYQRDEFILKGQLASLDHPNAFTRLLNQAVARDWVVYAKRPFGGPRQVLKYLARYTHRVAISNERLLKLDGDRVAFRWKDYARGSQQQAMTLDGCEFLRRFLLHTLPRGFVRIRHYGYLSNRDRTRNLDRCRELLDSDGYSDFPKPSGDAAQPDDVAENSVREIRCPACETGRMIVIELVPRQAAKIPRPHFSRSTVPERIDSS